MEQEAAAAEVASAAKVWWGRCRETGRGTKQLKEGTQACLHREVSKLQRTAERRHGQCTEPRARRPPRTGATAHLARRRHPRRRVCSTARTRFNPLPNAKERHLHRPAAVYSENESLSHSEGQTVRKSASRWKGQWLLLIGTRGGPYSAIRFKQFLLYLWGGRPTRLHLASHNYHAR